MLDFIFNRKYRKALREIEWYIAFHRRFQDEYRDRLKFDILKPEKKESIEKEIEWHQVRIDIFERLLDHLYRNIG